MKNQVFMLMQNAQAYAEGICQKKKKILHMNAHEGFMGVHLLHIYVQL